MTDLDFILGLMRANTDALGFIPAPTVETRYVAGGRYVVQTNERGQRTGYILHGKPTAGGVLTIAQAVVEYDWRGRGEGREAVQAVIERAQRANCRAITLRCADGLEANAVWQALGFERTCTLHIPNRRQRAIHVYTLDLWPTLFSLRTVPDQCGGEAVRAPVGAAAGADVS